MNKLYSIKNNLNIDISTNINSYESPDYIYIPNNNNYSINDYVEKGEYIDNYTSSVSGKVVDIKNNYLVIKNDFKETKKYKKKTKEIDNIDDLVKLLKSLNYIELSNKLNIDNINKFIVTAIDEDYYSINEYIYLVNKTREILDTINKIEKIFNIKESTLVIKNTSYHGIKNIKSIIGSYPTISVFLVPNKYLISEKEFLCSYLKIDKNNTLILTLREMFIIYNALFNRRSTSNKIITISGNNINNGLVIDTRLYVSLKELLDNFITYDKDSDIYINGLFKGKKIKKIEKIYIDESISHIVINKKEEEKDRECINCGACTKVCPYNINVKKCYDKMLKHQLCNNCGLCNYICPANINLKKVVSGDYHE